MKQNDQKKYEALMIIKHRNDNNLACDYVTLLREHGEKTYLLINRCVTWYGLLDREIKESKSSKVYHYHITKTGIDFAKAYESNKYNLFESPYSILEAVRDCGGEASLSDLRSKTGLSIVVIWRRSKKAIDLGLIDKPERDVYRATSDEVSPKLTDKYF
jgi:hypothetical protein